MNAVMNEITERQTRMDPRLGKVDALASRWARIRDHQSRRHPLETIRLMHDGAILGGAPVPLGDDVLAFDQVYASAPMHEKSVLHVWYRTGGSAKQKAQRLRIGRTTLYLEWKVALQYMKGELVRRDVDV